MRQGEDMTRRLIGSGSTFEEQIGYSRAVVDGEWVFVSGTTGFNYAAMSISDNLLEQTEQCFRNISAALDSAGATLRDVVRVLYILPDGAEFPPCWPVLRKYFGDVRPAATMISCRARRPAHEDRDPGDGAAHGGCRGAALSGHLAAFEPGAVPSYDAGPSSWACGARSWCEPTAASPPPATAAQCRSACGAWCAR